MSHRTPPYLLLVLLLAACAGTEVGNPTYGCMGDDGDDGYVGAGGSGGHPGEGGVGGGEGGTGGIAPSDRCEGDGSSCGLHAYVDAFDHATCPGGSAHTTLFLENLTAEVLSGHVQVADGATVEVVPDRFELPPLGSEALAVIFAPPEDAAAGQDGATLHVVLDGPPQRYVVVQVQAWVDPSASAALGFFCGGPAPCDFLDFGTSPVATAAHASVVVLNEGCQELDLPAPDLGSDERLVLRDPPPFPVTLAPGETLPLALEFTPDAVGATTGDIAFATDAGSWLLPWIGRGE